MVKEESRLLLLGPEPIKVAGPSAGPAKRKPATTVKRSAPRVMDDLF
jgi:penicillin-binding protein 1A